MQFPLPLSHLGQISVATGLFASLFAFACALSAGVRQSIAALFWARRATWLWAASMFVANAVMMVALVSHDFSVGYVTQVGSRATPPLISAVSLWSSLEGSILFWNLILALFVGAFLAVEGRRHLHMMPWVITLLMGIAAFFAYLVAGPASPFATIAPMPPDGPGPNPLLQNHPLMVIHPPMLYLGYVGLAVPFALAVAALIEGRLEAGWLRTLRRWTLIPWMFLSVGIILGGWWAYEVLGWGGYWAWDPVENASFLPWLVATAYLHATVIHERRRMFKAWTLSLIMGAFLMTILGTFMTRSGVFNSVHSFTQSPIGPLFLIFLGVLCALSLGLLAGRSHLLVPDGHLRDRWTREGAFLLNNLLLTCLTFTVLLGTVFPLIVEATRGVKLSVGEPYYDKMAAPLGLLLVFLMGVAPVLPWDRANSAGWARRLIAPAAWAFGIGVITIVKGIVSPLVVATYALSAFAAYSTLRVLLSTPLTTSLKAPRGQKWSAFTTTLLANRRQAGGMVIHLAVVVLAVAISSSQAFRQHTEASLVPGETVTLGEYTLTYRGPKVVQEAHRMSVMAQMEVATPSKVLGGMRPRLNFYKTQREPVGTPHVATLGSTDLYVSLLSMDPDGQRIGVRVFLIPMAPWLWRSLPLWVVGALISLWPRRRRRRAARAVHVTPGLVSPSGAVSS